MSDTAYIVSYKKYRSSHKALVIASNPIRACEKLKESLSGEAVWGFSESSVSVNGELPDLVKEAQDNGVAEL
jgi:hypothetical protein